MHPTFQHDGDRRGMYHAEFLAPTGIHRARGCGKHDEARAFARWLGDNLDRGSELSPPAGLLDLWPDVRESMEDLAVA